MKRFFSIAVMVAGMWAAQAAAKTQADVQKYPADVFAALTTQTGWLNTARPLKADDLRGRIVLVDFWTYCCINCIHIMPDIAKLENEFGTALTVVGVHSAKFKNEKDDENIRHAIMRYNLHHPVVNDFDFSTWRSFRVTGWPTLMLINPEGGVEKVYSGEGHLNELEQDIGALVNRYGRKLRRDELPLKPEANKAGAHVLSYPGKVAAGLEYKGKAALVVADTGHNRLVITTLKGEMVETIGSMAPGYDDGSFEEAKFNAPQGVIAKGEFIYVADTGNHLLRLVDVNRRTVTTVAGTGRQGRSYEADHADALRTTLSSPWDVAFWPDDRHVAIAMAGLHQIWSYDVEERTVSVVAGTGDEGIKDGPAARAHLAQTSGLAAVGDKLYFVDAETSSLRVLEKGEVKTLIGSGLFDFGYVAGNKATARMQHPLGLAATDKGLFVADAFNHAIRRYDLQKGVLENYAGTGSSGDVNGKASEARFNEPGGLAVLGQKLYVADSNNQALRAIDLKSHEVKTLSQEKAIEERGYTLSETLPNVMEAEPIKVAEAAPAQLTLSLQKGWHINADAPSYLVLFDLLKDNEVAVSFDRSALMQNRLGLGERVGTMYRLQGTFYYCEDKEGAQCMVKSIDVPLSFEKDAPAQASIVIN